jgi:hypothetical protein
MTTDEEKSVESESQAAEVAPLHAPCPPTGGATSSRQMSSTITAPLTDYQYWFFKMHGHPTKVS